MDKWKQLLAQLRAQHELPANVSDLEGVKAHIAAKNIVLQNKDGTGLDVDAIYAANNKAATKSVVTLNDPDQNDNGDSVEVIGLAEKVAAQVLKRLGSDPSKMDPGRKINLGSEDGERLTADDVKVKSLESVWKREGGHVFDSHQKAFAFGNALVAGPLAPYVNADLVGKAKANCESLRNKGYLTFPTSVGGALTATQFAPDIIVQLPQFGVLARHAYQVQMTDTRWQQSKAAGYLTVSYPDEGSAPSTTQQTWSNITLLAKKGIAIVKSSREINEDAMANLGDHTARELARSFARQEDLNGFSGDNSTTYGRMRGIIDIFGSTATADSRSVTGGDTTAAHTMANLHATMAALATWARPGAAWFCHPTIAALTFDRLGAAQGGVTWRETMDYGSVRMFLGHPVIEVEVMNANGNTGGDVVDILFGNMREAVALGRRKELTIEVSDQRYWDEHNLGMKGVIRHDVNVYSLGSTSEAGPLVALFQT
jgi:HK97 family phage major capsid protein